MADKVEIVFKRERSKEKPGELIARYLSTHLADTKEDYEVYPEGRVISGISWQDDKIYGVYRKTFYLSTQYLITIRPGGGTHVLEYRQVDREFFVLCKYPDPDRIWELLDMLKRRTEKSRRFTGPPHLRQFVRNLTDSTREDFKFEPHPVAWQAAISCKCTCDVFRVRYLGDLLPEGLLCDTQDDIQRTEIICEDCGRANLLFDPTIHGYNAVISENMPGPLGLRKTTHVFLCQCGNDNFQAAVNAFYDAEPDVLAEMSARQRNDSYGWFNASLKCVQCGRLIRFVDYECA